MRGETYHAVLGGGAWLGDDAASRCRPAAPLDQALVGDRLRRTSQTRRAHQAGGRGSGSSRGCGTSGGAGRRRVDLCDVAAGRLDGYYERGLNPWDLAAGDLIAREAGALTGGRPGEPASGRAGAGGDARASSSSLQPLLEESGAWHD